MFDNTEREKFLELLNDKLLYSYIFVVSVIFLGKIQLTLKDKSQLTHGKDISLLLGI